MNFPLQATSERWRSTTQDIDRYDVIAVVLHWSTAILIVGAFALGLSIDDFPKDWESSAINAHALIGVAVLVLTIARLAWRAANPPPPLPVSLGPMTRLASRAVHVALYVLMVAIPLIGVPALLYRGRGLNFGLFAIASPFDRTLDLYRPLTEVHEIAAYAIIGLAVFHAAAVLYHQFFRRDNVLLRMLPGSLRAK